jgi:hypothetical protein
MVADERVENPQTRLESFESPLVCCGMKTEECSGITTTLERGKSASLRGRHRSGMQDRCEEGEPISIRAEEGFEADDGLRVHSGTALILYTALNGFSLLPTALSLYLLLEDALMLRQSSQKEKHGLDYAGAGSALITGIRTRETDAEKQSGAAAACRVNKHPMPMSRMLSGQPTNELCDSMHSNFQGPLFALLR